MAFMSGGSTEVVGKSFGFFMLFGSLGSLIGGMISPYIASIYGFEILFAIAAILDILTIFPIIIKKIKI